MLILYIKIKLKMEILKYNQQGLKPGVVFDTKSGKFEITGKACPENVVEFFKPILEWLDNYKDNPIEKTVFEFKLEYYNTASSKMLFVIMQKLEPIAEAGKEVLIRWYFPEDDEALEEAGEEFDELIDLPSELIPYDSED